MTLMMQSGPISQWLMECGLSRQTALKAAEAAVGPLATGSALSQDQMALLKAYLGRRGASHAADAGLAAVVKRQGMFPMPNPTPTPDPPGPTPMPYPILTGLPPKKPEAKSHTPEWLKPRPGDPGPAKEPQTGHIPRSVGDEAGTRAGGGVQDMRMIQALAHRVAR